MGHNPHKLALASPIMPVPGRACAKGQSQLWASWDSWGSGQARDHGEGPWLGSRNSIEDDPSPRAAPSGDRLHRDLETLNVGVRRRARCCAIGHEVLVASEATPFDGDRGSLREDRGTCGRWRVRGQAGANRPLATLGVGIECRQGSWASGWEGYRACVVGEVLDGAGRCEA
jgi:hypothetical protein